MKKNLKILVIVLVVLGIIFLTYNYRTKFSSTNPPVITEEGLISESLERETCEALKNTIKNTLDEINHCRVDSDCKVKSICYCPFGSYWIFNKNTNLDFLNEKLKIFKSNNCSFCEYKCLAAPEQKDLECINNKCVDIRRN